MGRNIIGSDRVVQVGIIVKDIENTSRKFAAFFGVEKPPAIVTGAYEDAHTEYRGKKTGARAKLAFFKTGQVDIELIEPDEHPSTWREFLDTHGEGVHHLAFFVKGMKPVVAAMAENGYPLLQKGEYTGGRYAYMDTAGDLKTILELLEND